MNVVYIVINFLYLLLNNIFIFNTVLNTFLSVIILLTTTHTIRKMVLSIVFNQKNFRIYVFRTVLDVLYAEGYETIQ